MTSVKRFIENHGEQLPSPSGVALAITELWRHEDTTVDQLARVIQTDPALSGRLLKLANSASLGGRPIAAIPEAIVKVGMRTVGQLAVTFSLIDNAKDGRCEVFDYEFFWAQSLLAALLGRALAQANAVAAPDDIFACGLLSRTGALALATVYPREYADLLSAEEDSLRQREQRLFGFDNGELSYELMLSFGVPDALAGPARFHQNSLRAHYGRGTRPYKIAAMLHLAYTLSVVIAQDPANEDAVSPEQFRELSALGEFSADQLSTICEAVIPEWREWTRMLALPEDFDGDLNAIAAEIVLASQLDDHEPEGKHGEAREALLISADAGANRFTALLESSGYSVTCQTDDQPVGAASNRPTPGLVLLEAMEEPSAAAKHCQWLRSSPGGMAAYVIALRSGSDRAEEDMLFKHGIDGLFDVDGSDASFHARLVAVDRHAEMHAAWRREQLKLKSISEELAATQDQIQHLSLEDSLTLLPNRKAAMQALEKGWAASERAEQALSLLMIDIDQFWRVNDRFGQDIGDQVLKDIASRIKTVVRTEEPLFRLGGEEFLVISTVSSMRPMLIGAERVRDSVFSTQVQAGKEKIQVTVSVGLAERQESDENVDGLLAAAMRAMYLAKVEGRNRTAFRVGTEFRLVPKR